MKQMKEVLLGWEKHFAKNSEISKGLRELRNSSIGSSHGFDLRQMSSLWISFIRDQNSSSIRERISGRGKAKKLTRLLIFQLMI